MFKNIFLASVIAAVLVVSASQPAQALTAAEVQAQIQALLAKVAELTNQLNQIRMQGGASVVADPSTGVSSMPALPMKHRICTLLARNLAQGSSGDDVRGLQEFLYEQKLLTVAPTGYFGQMTGDAVKRWQANEGVSAVGAFGPMSRERIRVWCGGWNNTERFSASPLRGEAPLTVVFETWLSGFRVSSIYYTIDFGDGASEHAADCYAPADACQSSGQNRHTYTANGTYTATLNKITDPCPYDGNPNTPRCLAAMQNEVVGRVQIFVRAGGVSCTKEYMPVCGAQPIVCITTPCNPIPTTYGNRCMMLSDGASLLYEGQCRSTTIDPAADPQCKAWYDGCNSCSRQSPGGLAACTLRYCAAPEAAYCTAYFESTNRPPSVSGLTGPTTLSVGGTGNWIIQATDPEGGPLSYSVDWGESSAALEATALGSSAFRQSTSFSHAYWRAGTYMITVIVTDNSGQTSRASTTVQVGSTPIACTMQYDPVCGRLTGCANTCQLGMVCPAMCQLHTPQTYGNRCMHDAAGAQFIHTGECTSTSGNTY